MASGALPPATPQRPLPGAFLTTPAPAPSIFSQNSQSLRQPQSQLQQSPTQPAPNAPPTLSAIERAARTINDTFAQEARFPALEDYVQNGSTSDYELPKSQAWHPYQTLKQYDIPTKILEQANHSSINMHMGMFAPLGHAWAAIDNCLYLWDYTIPNPGLIGYEENKSTIERVELITPKPGVFVKEISHVIVVSTTTDVVLLGVAPTTTSTGAKTLTLYTTRMSISVRSVGVSHIVGTSSGRIFFTGDFSDEINEFTYKSDEGWFSGRCGRLQYATSGGIMSNATAFRSVTALIGSKRASKYIQLLPDDSRGLLYTLDEANTIGVWTAETSVSLALSKSFSSLLQASAHFTARTELLSGRDVWIASLSVIPAAESTRLAIVATTNTGCRLYISLTRGFSSVVNAQHPPGQMAITHVRLPPRDQMALAQPQAISQGQQLIQANGTNEPASQYLMGTEDAFRLPPGYTVLILKDKERNDRSRAFLLAEDLPRLKNPQDTSALSSRFIEFGQWLSLPSAFNELQVLTPSFGAAATPTGFGNELSVQYDQASTEFAIMTSSGIYTMRRRRLVDVFASIMRYGTADDEGIEGDVKKFVRAYGRGETAATSLAVACGQGLEVTSDARVANITDAEILSRARSAFVEHGGKPEFNANSVVNDNNAIENVKPSPRHEGLALYISRLIRSIWKAKLVIQQIAPGQLPVVSSVVPAAKLKSVQKSLSDLQKFLNDNSNLIEGLSGPKAMARLGSRTEEIALQGEHRAMNSLLVLLQNLIEGLSFALVLFEERIEDILALLSPEHKQQVIDLTYEELFVSSAGHTLAKELVKAIVNRNIAKGANVETVADSLRRKCGSFCSADDAVIFKAQELVKKAQAVGPQTESGRALFNESQRYFQKVAGSLSEDLIKWAVDQYVQAQFWAGAIQLCLSVAQAKDTANRALGWLRDGMADGDARKSAFEARKPYYDFIFGIITSINQATQGANSMDGIPSISSRRRNEADEIINDSEDQIFQTCLYDWYVANGQEDRLLRISSPFIVDFLKLRSQNDRKSADLLWRYYAHGNQYLEAAEVQYQLANGYFEMTLEERISYLGRARINASTRQAAIVDNRQNKQQLLREISDRLEVANIQDDILQRIKNDARLSDDRRREVVAILNSNIMELGDLYNHYADQAGYHDICLLIYQCADHRNPNDIRQSWQALIEQTDHESQALYGKDAVAWEVVGNKVREVGKRLHTSDAVFQVSMLFPMLERYAAEPRSDKPPSTWAVDVFLDLDVPCETLLPVAEQIYYSNEVPFTGTKRRIIATHMVYIAERWKQDSLRKGERVVFGNDQNAAMILELLATLLRGDNLVGQDRRDAEVLSSEVQRLLR